MRTCDIDDCGQQHVARGYCEHHYRLVHIRRPSVYARECAWCGKAYVTRYR